MTLDEFLKQVRERADSVKMAATYIELDVAAEAAEGDVPRLLAIIEAQRAELEKAEKCVEAWERFYADADASARASLRAIQGMPGPRGNAAIAKRFEMGEL